MSLRLPLLRGLCGAVLAALSGSLAPAPAAAAEAVPVDLELVLAADVSDSMDIKEQWLQRLGFAAAFRDAGIVKAITGGKLGRIAVTYIEWADVGQPKVVAPWALIDGRATAHAFAQALETTQLARMRKTSISGALLFASHLIENNGFSGRRRIIDISGDGPNNQGAPVLRARDEVVARGIVIHGLPIQLERKDKGRSLGAMFGTPFDTTKLDIYYEDCVIGGPGSFILPVKSLEAMADGIRNKLFAEIAGVPVSVVLPAVWRRPRRLAC